MKVVRPERSDVPSIAVLPFANLSSHPEQEYLCHGLTEEVITALARAPGLRVTARTSAFSAGVADRDIRDLGRWLGVDVIVEGTVRRSGETLRVTAHLVDAGTGYHLWAERYDRHATGMPEIQDEIARAVASTLRQRLVEMAAPTRSTTDAGSIIAAVRLCLGEAAAALLWLERAVGFRDTTLVLLPLWPDYDPLRADRRLQRLLDRVRLWPRPVEPGPTGV